MRRTMRLYFYFLVIGTFCLSIWACGGSVARYNPGPSAVPGDLSVIASGDGQVTLAWTKAYNAAAYAIYYSTSQGVTKANGTKFGTTTGTSAIVTGLENDTLYYFVVASVNSSGESGVSNEVSGTPSAQGLFKQSDLTGTWKFNILVTGTNAGWMRGKLTIDASGIVAFSSFLDSTGNTSAPAGLFPMLLLDATGRVTDSDSPEPDFHGDMSIKRNMVVGTSSPSVASRSIAILQKQVEGVTFSNDGDIKGFGNTAGGARRFVYTQISSGSLQEWEFAMGQIGGDQGIQYSEFTAPSNPVKPGVKATSFSISVDGIVTESRGGATPQPAVVIPAGTMSSDKSVIVATTTDESGTGNKFILRIYQMINIVPSDTNSFTLADQVGEYSVQQLFVGASNEWAFGALSIDASGLGSFSSYLVSTGGTTPPSPYTQVNIF